MKLKSLLPATCAFAGLAIAAPSVALAQAVLEGSGEHTTIDCDRGDAQISGSSNHVTVEGGCRALHVEGSGNVVTAQMAEKGAIRVVGTSNRVMWTAPGQSKPRVSSTGVGNSISRAR